MSESLLIALIAVPTLTAVVLWALPVLMADRIAALVGTVVSGVLLVASIVLMLASIAGLIWLAARIYERAVLRIGAPMKLIEGLRLARGER